MPEPGPGLFASSDANDPYLWLEEVLGDSALDWVRERNAEAQAALALRPEYDELRQQFLAVLDDRQRIPGIQRIGDLFYNFWQDADHVRGLWRRCTLDGYRQDEPPWQTVLDLDALAAAEGENWVWKGAVLRPPFPDADADADGAPGWTRALLQLSRGGADAVVLREFDLVTGRFVPEGFHLPEAKTRATWLDADTLLVGSDTGPGSLTDSGYPRQIRRWRRGTPLQDAPVVFEGEAGDVSVSAWVDATPGYQRAGFSRALDFYRSRDFLWSTVAGNGELRPLPKPEDADLSLHEGWALLSLRSDLSTADANAVSAGQPTLHPAGSLLVTPLAELLDGRPGWHRLFTPGPRRSLAGWDWTARDLLLTVLDQVATQVERWRWVVDAGAADGGTWQCQSMPKLPGPGSLSVQTLHDPCHPGGATADPLAQALLLHYTDFLTPDSLMRLSLDRDHRGDGGGPELLKQRSRHFEATGMRVEQRWARSRDGCEVPYFIVWPAGVAARAGGDGVGDGDGDHPTLLYGYGGFEVSLQPWYSAAMGRAWFARGGVLVVANLRGGGEFGPAWHQAAVGEHKQKSYDDCIAIAEALQRSGVTRPTRLGLMGGSNGGLMVAAIALQRPDLFGAVVCQVPLLDMRRYHRLLAGASWMAEYGDPDRPEDWGWISRYSPYQRLQPGVQLPPMLLTTSTRDDRVHPGHARKMVARLRELGLPVLYHEAIEGGHGGAADNQQRARLMALEYSFLWSRLGPG